jgi:hypothetical protein
MVINRVLLVAILIQLVLVIQENVAVMVMMLVVTANVILIQHVLVIPEFAPAIIMMLVALANATHTLNVHVTLVNVLVMVINRVLLVAILIKHVLAIPVFAVVMDM